MVEEEAPEYLSKLYRSQCLQGKHIYMKPLRVKKGVAKLCQLCYADICESQGSKKPLSCGLTNPRKLTYCPEHNYLCEYSTQAYNHKCHCIICNPRQRELLDYFNKIKPQLNLQKSNLKAKRIAFKVEF